MERADITKIVIRVQTRLSMKISLHTMAKSITAGQLVVNPLKSYLKQEM
jgi:hypothetical protein